MIKVDVLKDGKLVVYNSTISDSIRYEKIKFNFPSGWDGYTKTAIFKNFDKAINVVLNCDNNLCTGVDECYIPHEVIKTPEFTVSVFGTKEDSRITTSRVRVKVLQSGYEEGDIPLEPTLEVYEQLVGLANKTLELAQSVRNDADNGKFKGDKGEQGIRGEKGDPFTYSDFTTEQLKNLKGETGPQGARGLKGDKGDKGDRGEQGLQGIKGEKGEKGDKGDKGDPFTYSDFTPEQLAGLRGEKGDDGVNGKDGYTPQKGVDYFTDEDVAGLNIPVVDPVFTSESENAQSGKAVAKYVVTEQKRTNNTFSNALKGNKSGSAILIDDVSPVTHDIEVKISSDTVPDLTAVKVSRYGKNLITYPYFYASSTYAAGSTYTNNGITFTVNEDRSITANGTATAEAFFCFFDASLNSALVSDADKFFVTLSGCPSGGSSTTYFLAQRNFGFKDIGNGVKFQTGRGANSYAIIIKSGITVENLVFKPQLELGTKATKYEPFITPIDYRPNADGMVDDVESVYPNMTLFTDIEGVTINCTYNVDTKKYIENKIAELTQ